MSQHESPTPQEPVAQSASVVHSASTAQSTAPALGTLHTPGATRVLILGAGELGKELTFAFRKLGVEVHAADADPHAIALSAADVGHVVDPDDPQAVVELVGRIHPTHVVPEFEWTAPAALARIDAAGIPIAPSAKAAQLAWERERIRRVASEELGLPTSAYEFADTYEEYTAAIAEMGYPCVVKPLRSRYGRGQSIVESDADLQWAWDTARWAGGGDTPRIMVERFVEFDCEVTILTVRSIDPATGKDATWFCEPIGHRRHEGRLVESWQPMYLSPAARDNARSVAARITNALGGRGVFAVELFLAGDDVYFSAVSPRPDLCCMVTVATQRFSEFDLHARAILGLPVDVTLTSPGALAVIIGEEEIAAENLRCEGVEQALALPESDLRYFGKHGSTLNRRMGVTLATAETAEAARETALKAVDYIRLVDSSKPTAEASQQWAKDEE